MGQERRYSVHIAEEVDTFEDLTRDGYRLMAIDSAEKSSDDIVPASTESYYYFQKME